MSIGESGNTPGTPRYDRGYTPASVGPKNPQNYPFVRDNYNIWGEQPGYIYDPYTDTYVPDPKAVKEYEDRFGLTPLEPKEPGLMDTVLPLAGAAGAVTLGSQLIKDPSGLVGGFAGIPNALGLGGATEAASGAAASSAGASGLGGGVAGAPGMPQIVGTESPGLLGSLWGGGGAPEIAGQGWLGGGGLGMAAAIPAGAFTGYQQATGIADALKGDDMSFMQEAALALPTFGASFLVDPVKDMFGWGDQDMWKTEGNRLRELQEQGVNIPQSLIDQMPTSGRSFDEMQRGDLAADFIGRDANNQWVNNKFNMSRDVADLRPEDIVGYAAFWEKDPGWESRPLDERLQIADRALKEGAVSEHHGTIDLSDQFSVSPQAAVPTGSGGSSAGKPGFSSGATVNSMGQIVPPKQQSGHPPKGTRLSPGIYADGKGGSYRK